ncbi:MAG: hypothetical protein J1E29_06825, partial [Duncaniella sp.]|nr:hypothetical protein [Duncaniella sp.]
GFWFADGASAKVVKNGMDGESYCYDLILKVPCSGAYDINIAPTDKSIAFFDKDSKIITPVGLEIYPNLTALFNSSKG